MDQARIETPHFLRNVALSPNNKDIFLVFLDATLLRDVSLGTGYSLRTQFEIECRCGGHSVTKKFKTILQILLAKPKLWKNLYF